jgi:hypothetical protein
MAEADGNDRGSVERAYPRQAFDEDARANALPNAAVRHGVRIEAERGGRFRVSRAAQHVGEDERSRHGVFLAPSLAQAVVSIVDRGADGGMAGAGVPADEGSGYEAFIERIIEAARDAEPVAAPGRGDERLAGPRQ